MQSSGVYLILNQAGEIVYVMDKSRPVMGYESRELIGKKAFGLLFARLQYQYFVTENNSPLSTVVPVKHKDGTVMPMRLTVVSLKRAELVQRMLINLSPIS